MTLNRRNLPKALALSQTELGELLLPISAGIDGEDEHARAQAEFIRQGGLTFDQAKRPELVSKMFESVPGYMDIVIQNALRPEQDTIGVVVKFPPEDR